MTHLLSFLLFIHFFHTEYPLLIETSLLRTHVFFLFFIFIISKNILLIFSLFYPSKHVTSFSVLINSKPKFIL